MSYQIEGVKGGTVHYLDNIRFIQVLKAVAFKVNCDSVRISDIYGNEIQTKIHNGIFNYVLTEDPIYIIENYTENGKPTRLSLCEIIF